MQNLPPVTAEAELLEWLLAALAPMNRTRVKQLLRSGRGGFQEGDCFFMNTEQGFEVKAQGGIIGTGFPQIGTTLAGGQLQGRAKECDFAIGRGVHRLLNTIGNFKSQAPL